MIAIMRFIIALVPALMLAACVSEPRQSAPPPPPPAPIAPRPAPAPPPLASNWEDWPVTPGTWAWRKDARGSVAMFGAAGTNALFVARCDKAVGAVFLSRSGTVSGAANLQIRTSSALKQYGAQTNGDTPPYVAARLSSQDSGLDAIAYSRGRFVVTVSGMPDLVVPAWPEFTRVVEDCRG